MSMAHHEIEEVARAAGVAAANQTLKLMGIDPDQPFQMQADFAHLRRWRVLVERSAMGAIMSFIALIVTGFGVYLGFGRH